MSGESSGGAHGRARFQERFRMFRRTGPGIISLSFAVGIVIVAFAWSIQGVLAPILDPDEQLLYVFSTAIITIHVVLMITFVGVYFILLSIRAQNTQSRGEDIQQLDFPGVPATMALLKDTKLPFFGSTWFSIGFPVVLILFAKSLSQNPHLTTFLIIITLEASIIAASLFILFSSRIASITESLIRGSAMH